MDELIRTMVSQSYALRYERMNMISEQYIDQSRHVSTQSNQMFVQGSQFINHSALNRIPSGMPERVLEHNAAAGQPFNSPKAS